MRCVVQRSNSKILSWLITLASCLCFVGFLQLYHLLHCIRHRLFSPFQKGSSAGTMVCSIPDSEKQDWGIPSLLWFQDQLSWVWFSLLHHAPSHLSSSSECLRGVAFLAPLSTISLTPFQSILRAPATLKPAKHPLHNQLEPGMKGTHPSLSPPGLTACCSLSSHLNPSAIFYGYRETAFRHTSNLLSSR